MLYIFKRFNMTKLKILTWTIGYVHEQEWRAESFKEAYYKGTASSQNIDIYLT